jgi:hypothetical protein
MHGTDLGQHAHLPGGRVADWTAHLQIVGALGAQYDVDVTVAGVLISILAKHSLQTHCAISSPT